MIQNNQATRSRKRHLGLWSLATVAIASLCSLTQGQTLVNSITGIGYNEQQPGEPRRSRYTARSQGVNQASFEGDTNIYVECYDLHETASANKIVLYSQELDLTIEAPALTTDDTRDSDPSNGRLSYRLPSLAKLFEVPASQFDKFSYMRFNLYILRENEDGEVEKLGCATASYCQITYRIETTPTLYTMNPPVAFQGCDVEYWFDSKNIQAYNSPILESDSLPFVDIRLGDTQLDLEGRYTASSSFVAWQKDKVRGKVKNTETGKTSMKLQWETGSSKKSSETQHCNFDLTECYESKLVPVIDNISSCEGYTTGGQVITINGNGFGSSFSNLDVKVGGASCKVKSVTSTCVTCEVQEGGEIEADGPREGTMGISRKFISGLGSLNILKLSTYAGKETTYTTLERHQNIGDYTGDLYRGWFVAPETANYKFYMSCDDQCIMKFNKNPMSTLDLTTLLTVTKASAYRDYWTQDGVTRISEEVSLRKGDRHYIEVSHIEYNGADHLSCGVEIIKQVDKHPQATKEIQTFEVMTTQQYEKTKFTVTDISGSVYRLLFFTSKGQYVQSSDISDKASAATFYNAVKGYYSTYVGTTISVDLEMFDVDGNLIEDETACTKRIYTVTLNRLISGTSAMMIFVIIIKPYPYVTVDMPAMVQLSKPPLTGSFKIKCVAPDGTVSYTQPLTVAQGSAFNVEYRIKYQCVGFQDMVTVSEMTNVCAYKDNCLKYRIRFNGLNAKPGQFMIVSDDTSPLEGDGDLQYDGKCEQSYGSSVFYEQIPYEMLRTYVEKSQIKVKVGNELAICGNNNCGYTFKRARAVIKKFTYTKITKILIIEGTDLPENENEVEVSFGDVKHKRVISCSSTKVEVELEDHPRIGKWKPVLKDKNGRVPCDSTVEDHEESGEIGDATCDRDDGELNVLGDDHIKIKGKQFPKHMIKEEWEEKIKIYFDNEKKCRCRVVDIQEDEITCKTDGFDKDVERGKTFHIDIEINGHKQRCSKTFYIKTLNPKVSEIGPISMSASKKTIVYITIDMDLGYEIFVDDFEIVFHHKTRIGYTRRVRCFHYDYVLRKLSCKFGGGWSGVYTIEIKHKKFGKIDAEGKEFNVESKIISISPRTGSNYGGTILTLKGTNWGGEPEDNPVEIHYGYLDGVIRNTKCFVISNKEDEIKCRIDDSKVHETGKEGKVIVFLKTYEEATCAIEGGCTFTFTNTVPEVTSVVTEWHSESYRYHLRVTGVNLFGNKDLTDFRIKGRKQRCISITETEAVFEIIDSSSHECDGMDVTWEIGRGKNSSALVKQTLTPKLISCHPKVGSASGTELTLNVQGVGPSTTGLYIVDASGVSVCASLVIPSYGVVKCRTRVGDVVSSTKLRVKHLNKFYGCENSDESECTYEQISTSTHTSTVNTCTSDGEDSVVFEGVNLPSTGYQCSCKIRGIEADEVKHENGKLRGIWKNGVPSTDVDEYPEMSCTQTETNVTYYIVIKQKFRKVKKSKYVSKRQSCSFEGGEDFEYENEGVTTLLEKDSQNHWISICDERCEFDKGKSSKGKAVCKIPKQHSTLTMNTEEGKVPNKLQLTNIYFGSGSNYKYAFDNKLKTATGDNSANCHIGQKFQQGYIGDLVRVNVYIKGASQSKHGTLIFQGSNDMTTWENIYELGNDLVEGWNLNNFEKGSHPQYNAYRFFGTAAGACNIQEIRMIGIKKLVDDSAVVTCKAKYHFNGKEEEIDTIEYRNDKTPKLLEIHPHYGSVKGGETVTFTGENFSSNSNDYEIEIDGVPCTNPIANSVSVRCTTGKRPGLPSPSLKIYIKGKGHCNNKDDLHYKYVNRWSDETTWGEEYLPAEGESVWVPHGLNVLVDVDTTPILNLILVEGEIIFESNENNRLHHRRFDCHYIFVHKGRFEAGSELHPYNSKLTITLHGDKYTPSIPIYGNKVLAIRGGHCSMHGRAYGPIWDFMEETAEAGAMSIKMAVKVDWDEGDQIAIASSEFDYTHYEKRRIVSVDRTNVNKPILHLDAPLTYRHFSEIQTYGSEQIDMRTEVGLLTRNIVFRGSSDSEETLHGAYMMVHSHFDYQASARIDHVEFYMVGQAYLLGRYPIHFLMIGLTDDSSVKYCSIHNSYNRAITLHGVSGTTLHNNVVVNIMGHSIFLQDGVEKNNIISDNLVMGTKKSWSLLNSDQTPSSFWITHPTNHIYGNHAAGSDYYGFWYNLQLTNMGPSSFTGGCPENAVLGSFKNNTAHSNQEYGLNIHNKMIPRRYECNPITYDDSNSNPFWQNPLRSNIFYDFTAFKNMDAGASAFHVGDVRFYRFKTADNGRTGITIEMVNNSTLDDRAMIYDSLLIGASSDAGDFILSRSPAGIIVARTEWFTVKKCRFHNYNFNKAAALKDCPHCTSSLETDSGARTTKVSGLRFYNVDRRIQYQWPYRGIFWDLDGSLTGVGTNSYATRDYPHLMWPECTLKKDTHDGIVCDSRTQLRRISMYDHVPYWDFQYDYLKIYQWDQSVQDQYSDINVYLQNKTKYTTVNEKNLRDPSNGYTAVYATNHNYRYHYGSDLNFDKMKIQLSERWQETDKDIILYHNFTEKRVYINVTLDGVQIHNATISNTPAYYQTGQNFVYNDTEFHDPMEFLMVVNGKGSNQIRRRTIQLDAARCWGSCQEPITDVPIEERIRLWSVATDWTSRRVPLAGEDVIIEAGWNMFFDLEESAIYKSITINGRLTFKRGKNLHLQTHHLYNRGEFLIGSEESRFEHKAIITLHGDRWSEKFMHTSQILVGNKIIANVGKMFFYGIERTKMTRLYSEVLKGQTSCFIGKDLDWVQGDRIAIADNSFDSMRSDERIIESYDKITGELVVDRAFDFYHWGHSESTELKYGFDMRGEVTLLTRNIVVRGDDDKNWGGQVVTSEIYELDFVTNKLVPRIGQTIFWSVEVYNCSQYDLEHSSLRFDNAMLGTSSIKNSVVHNGHGEAILAINAKNIELSDNVIYKHTKYGIRLQRCSDFTIDNNLVMHISEKTITEKMPIFFPGAGISVCAIEQGGCSKITITNNIVAGANWIGFAVPGHSCYDDEPSESFKNNVAHSVRMGDWGYGAIIYGNSEDPEQSTCSAGSFFFAYKIRGFAMAGGYKRGPKQYVFKKNTLLDSNVGMSVGFSGLDSADTAAPLVSIEDNKIFAYSEIPDCPYGGDKGVCFILNEKSGMQATTFLRNTQPIHPEWEIDAPYHNFDRNEGTFRGKVELRRNKFYDFSDQSPIIFAQPAPDILPVHMFYDTKFINCSQKFAFRMTDPSDSWIGIQRCANFACTGPYNTFWHFENTIWENAQDSISDIVSISGDFQVIPNNPGFAPYVSNCVKVEKFNAYICQQSNIAMLTFESEDPDYLDRTMSPIYLVNDRGENNKLNHHMEHCWDGFHACLKRLSRYHGIIQGGPGVVYNVSYTGTPAERQVFLLEAPDATAGLTLRITYPDAGKRSIKKDGVIVEPNDWDEVQGAQGPVQQRFCGENRYIGVQNVLEFYITPGCVLRIIPREVVSCNVRLEWTFAEFFADGGTTRFVDRLSASLGIHYGDIKVVSVYEGSLIIDYEIISQADDLEELEQIRVKQIELLAKGLIDFGAPILDASITGGQIISNGVVKADGYEPIVITPTETNGGSNTQTSTSSSTSGSTTSSGGSSNQPNYNVKTGTMKEFSEGTTDYNWDPFAGMKVLTEEQKVLKDKIINEYNEQRAKIEAAYQEQKAILEKQKVEAEQKQELVSMILVVVIGAILIAFTIFGVIKVIKHFSPPESIKKQEEDYNEVDMTSFSNVKTATGNEMGMQFDPSSDMAAVHEFKKKQSQKQSIQPVSMDGNKAIASEQKPKRQPRQDKMQSMSKLVDNSKSQSMSIYDVYNQDNLNDLIENTNRQEEDDLGEECDNQEEVQQEDVLPSIKQQRAENVHVEEAISEISHE